MKFFDPHQLPGLSIDPLLQKQDLHVKINGRLRVDIYVWLLLQEITARAYSASIRKEMAGWYK